MAQRFRGFHWVLSFEAAGSISNEQNSAISKGQQKLIYRWWAFTSFYVQIAEIPVGLLKPTVGLFVSLGTSTLNIETIEVAAAMKNPGVLFKLVKGFEKTRCCQLPFESLVDCTCSITGQFEPLTLVFSKLQACVFLLYFYLDTSCSQLIWLILFQMGWKLKLPSIFQISPNIIYPDASWIVLDHHCQSQASIRFLAAWDEDAQGGRWLLLKISWRDFMVRNCPKSSASNFETHPHFGVGFYCWTQNDYCCCCCSSSLLLYYWLTRYKSTDRIQSYCTY